MEKEIQNLKYELSNFQKIVNEKLKIYDNLNNNRNKLDFSSDIFLDNKKKYFVLQKISNHIKSIN